MVADWIDPPFFRLRPGRGCEMKKLLKPLAWRRRAAARLQAIEEAQRAEITKRASEASVQAALSTWLAARVVHPSSGC